MSKRLVYEPGFLETGKVVYSEERHEYLIRTENGDFSIQDYLKTQYGTEVRVTGIRVESLQAVEEYYKSISETTAST